MTEHRHRSPGGGRRPPYADTTGRFAARRPGADRPALVDGSRFWEPEPHYDDLGRHRRSGTLVSLSVLAAALTLLVLAVVAVRLAWPDGRSEPGGTRAAAARGDARPSPAAPSASPGTGAPAGAGAAPGTGASSKATAPPDADTAPGPETSPEAGAAPGADPAKPSGAAPPGVPSPMTPPHPDPPVRVPSAPGRQAEPSEYEEASARRPEDGSARRGDRGGRDDTADGRDAAGRAETARGDRAKPRSRQDRMGHGARPPRAEGKRHDRDKATKPGTGSATRDSAPTPERRPRPVRPENRTGNGSGRGADQGTRHTPGGAGDPNDRLSAAYACRHISPNDWRYPYCVRAWNDHRRQLGMGDG